jgi:hypothetical protein
MDNRPSQEDKYHRVPVDFLKGIELIPHNFNLPEKPVHGEIVNRQLREDLFETAYNKVCEVEMNYLDGDDDFFKLEKIEKIDCENEGIFGKMLEKFSGKDDVSFGVRVVFRVISFWLVRNGLLILMGRRRFHIE